MEQISKAKEKDLEKLENEFWHQRLSKIAEDFKKRGYNLSFKIFFETHYSRASLKQKPSLIRDADIFIPEFVGWNENVSVILRAVSRGFSQKMTSNILNKAKIRHLV